MSFIMEPTYGYRHDQATPAVTWVITHNLNTQSPVVDCWVAGDRIMPLTVVATSTSVVTITFSTAESGVAYVA